MYVACLFPSLVAANELSLLVIQRTFDDNKNEEDDNSLWLPMLRRAIEDYTALVDGARKAKKDSPSYDRIVGVLAHDLGHFTR